ncbi:MAG: hypothetical protein M3R36_12775 [Bacteroidota bacterium]|nr:hypothetical protein [Bacteroidota bacterium]
MYIEATKSKIHHDEALLESFRAESIDSVVSFFLIYAMENSFQFLVEKQRIKIDHNLDLLKLIVNHYKSRIGEFKDAPLIRIFFYIGLCFLEFENESHYKKLEDTFRSNYQVIKKVDRKNIYAMMQTYCQEKMAKGKTIYREKNLDMMIEMLETNTAASAETEYFNLNFCRNLIVLAFLNKKTNVIEDFISKYLSSVNPVNRESIEHYAHAHLHYLRNRFLEALEECNKISFDELFVSTNDNMYFKNDVKKLTLICCYELNPDFSLGISYE